MAPVAPVISDDDIQRIIDRNLHLEGPLLPVLHGLQEAFGHIPAAAHQPIADALNITRAELHGVITFYHDFRDHPSGRHVLRLCRAEACQSVGGAELAAEVLGKLGLDWHGTSENGAVTIEPVYCLGLCACAPAAMLDERPLGRADMAGIERLLEEAGA